MGHWKGGKVGGPFLWEEIKEQLSTKKKFWRRGKEKESTGGARGKDAGFGFGK